MTIGEWCHPTGGGSSNGDGERRKLHALAVLAARRERYIRRGRRALLATLLDHGEATIDDARRVVQLPPGVNPVCFGGVPGELARAGIIRRTGFATTRRAVAHARPVMVWALIDRDAALAWLAEHPDMFDTATPSNATPPNPDACLFDPTGNTTPDAGTPGVANPEGHN